MKTLTELNAIMDEVMDRRSIDEWKKIVSLFTSGNLDQLSDSELADYLEMIGTQDMLVERLEEEGTAKDSEEMGDSEEETNEDSNSV